MHLPIAIVSSWAGLYAIVTAQWREALVLTLVFIANLFLAGSKKR
jgi:hypothetical protein